MTTCNASLEPPTDTTMSATPSSQLLWASRGLGGLPARCATTIITKEFTMKITVKTTITAPIEKVWRAWTTPEHIKKWNAASDDWHTTEASVDLRVGGAFSSRMEAKDGSMGFDFEGEYTKIVEHQLIESTFGERSMRVEFEAGPAGVTVRETFDAESDNSEEMQRNGWQAILDNFKRHVESAQKG